MIDVEDVTYLTTEDFVEKSTEIIAAIRELSNDLELLVKRYVNEKYLTTNEVAELLRCSPSAIPRELPCVHWGRNYLYCMSDIDKFFKSKRTAKRDF